MKHQIWFRFDKGHPAHSGYRDWTWDRTFPTRPEAVAYIDGTKGKLGRGVEMEIREV